MDPQQDLRSAPSPPGSAADAADVGTAHHGERGSIFIITVLLILSLIALGATYLTISTMDRKIAGNAVNSGRAFQLADAGLEDARSLLPSQNLDTLLAGGGNLIANTALGGGTYSVAVTNNVAPRFPTALVPLDAGGATNDTDNFVLATSTAVYRNATRVTEEVLQVTTSVFNYAVWSDSKSTISSSGVVDSWNSSAGTYAGTVGSNGNVFTNGTLTLSGSSQVKGNAEVASSTAPSSGHVTGSTTLNVPAQTMPNATCPGSYAPAANVVCGASCTYNAATGVLDVSSSTGLVTINAPPSSLYFSQITLSGGSTMTVNPGSHLDIFISGKLDASGGSVSNATNLPPTLTMSACGSGTQDFKLTGGSGAYFAIYAPNRKVTLSGSSDLYGAVVADNFDDSGGSTVHYDTALGGATAATPVARSWREVIP